jgi:hypothetical protein
MLEQGPHGSKGHGLTPDVRFMSGLTLEPPAKKPEDSEAGMDIGVDFLTLTYLAGQPGGQSFTPAPEEPASDQRAPLPSYANPADPASAAEEPAHTLEEGVPFRKGVGFSNEKEPQPTLSREQLFGRGKANTGQHTEQSNSGPEDKIQKRKTKTPPGSTHNDIETTQERTPNPLPSPNSDNRPPDAASVLAAERSYPNDQSTPSAAENTAASAASGGLALLLRKKLKRLENVSHAGSCTRVIVRGVTSAAVALNPTAAMLANIPIEEKISQIARDILYHNKLLDAQREEAIIKEKLIEDETRYRDNPHLLSRMERKLESAKMEALKAIGNISRTINQLIDKSTHKKHKIRSSSVIKYLMPGIIEQIGLLENDPTFLAFLGPENVRSVIASLKILKTTEITADEGLIFDDQIDFIYEQIGFLREKLDHIENNPHIRKIKLGILTKKIEALTALVGTSTYLKTKISEAIKDLSSLDATSLFPALSALVKLHSIYSGYSGKLLSDESIKLNNKSIKLFNTCKETILREQTLFDIDTDTNREIIAIGRWIFEHADTLYCNLINNLNFNQNDKHESLAMALIEIYMFHRFNVTISLNKLRSVAVRANALGLLSLATQICKYERVMKRSPSDTEQTLKKVLISETHIHIIGPMLRPSRTPYFIDHDELFVLFEKLDYHMQYRRRFPTHNITTILLEDYLHQLIKLKPTLFADNKAKNLLKHIVFENGMIPGPNFATTTETEAYLHAQSKLLEAVSSIHEHLFLLGKCKENKNDAIVYRALAAFFSNCATTMLNNPEEDTAFIIQKSARAAAAATIEAMGLTIDVLESPAATRSGY